MEVASPVLPNLSVRLRRLVRAKTHALSRLRDATQAFAQAFSLETLEGFERRRGRLMKLIELFDRRLASDASQLAPEARIEATLLEFLREQTTEQERLIHGVLANDEKILASIRDAQAELAREIARSGKQNQDLSRFKSEWVARSGEGVDSRA